MVDFVDGKEVKAYGHSLGFVVFKIFSNINETKPKEKHKLGAFTSSIKINMVSENMEKSIKKSV